MIVKRKQIWLLFPFVALLLTLALAIVGCGGTPTPKPQPTFALKVRPDTTEVQVGQSVAIVAEVEPLEKLDLKWSVSGTAEGTLNTDTGEQVVYTAGKKGGTDIVVAEGTTASGVPVKQTVSLTIATPVPPTDTPVPPTDTPVPPTDTPVPPTDTPVPPTDTPVPTTDTPVLPTDTPTSAPADECPFVSPIRIPIEGPSVDAEVSITSMENCADNLPTATSIPLAGTYSGDLTNKEIWILVYPANLVYYPQSTDACANISTPFANGQWSEIIRLGREGVPEAFHIVAVVTDIGSPASEAFHNYLTVGCTSGNYQGLTSVPPGATELDSITVHTR